MKIGIIFILLLCIGCSGTQQYSFSIRGNVEGAKYGKAFLLTPKEEVIYSTKIDGGDFELRGTLEEPGQYVLRVNRRQFMFFMDGKNMRIECPYRSFSSKYLKGSPANDLSIEYGKLQEDYTAKQERFFKEYKKATDGGNQKAADEAMTQVLLVGEAEFALTKEFVREHPDNIFSAYISEKAGRENYTKAKELYELLTPQAQQCSWGCLLKQHLDGLATSAEGLMCPEFTVSDEDGNQVTMSSLKGDILVLDFWASWCGPCRQEMKSLREQYKEFKDKGVRFVSISLDASSDKWKEACEEENIPWLSTLADGGWDDSEVRKLFGIQSIPHIVLVGKDGKIVGKNVRRNLLRDKIIELLNK